MMMSLNFWSENTKQAKQIKDFLKYFNITNNILKYFLIILQFRKVNICLKIFKESKEELINSSNN